MTEESELLSEQWQTELTQKGGLVAEQLARAAALHIAREVADPADMIDLVNIASWIMTGNDPWTTGRTHHD